MTKPTSSPTSPTLTPTPGATPLAPSRREALLGALFGAGYVGLRALATGLPAWYLLNPRRATAQDLQCALNAANLQYLIVSTNSNGDPLNCNVPGTYEGMAATAVHPMQAEMAPTAVTLGETSYQAALPWADKAAGGALSPATLSRISFFHHRTGTTVHGDQPKVMKLLGDTSGGEMFISAYAKHLATCFGTVQAAPIAVGARGNSSELVSFGGRMLPSISPTQLKQLLTGTTGRTTSSSNPLVSLRALRDTSLSQLNAMAKRSSSDVQRQFLDKLATSQTQVRSITETLQSTLTSITSDDVAGQALAAVALFVANVTPVVTMRIGFGGDNHTDNNLQGEVDQHVSGVQGIQAVMDALVGRQLQDKVTFATMNVFGRNLNGIAKVASRGGRDHYGNHSVMVMIGKNVKPGVVGGAIPGGSSGALVAADIDAATGALRASGGDIPASKTHVSAVRTLGAALGIPDGVAASDYIGSAGGKVVSGALSQLPG